MTFTLAPLIDLTWKAHPNSSLTDKDFESRRDLARGSQAASVETRTWASSLAHLRRQSHKHLVRVTPAAVPCLQGQDTAGSGKEVPRPALGAPLAFCRRVPCFLLAFRRPASAYQSYFLSCCSQALKRVWALPFPEGPFPALPAWSSLGDPAPCPRIPSFDPALPTSA